MSDWKGVLENPSARSILSTLGKEQASAVIELLYILTASDDEFTEAELDEVRAQLDRLSFHWAKDEREVRAVVAQAWQLGTNFDDREQVKAYVKTLAEQIPEGEARGVVFQMAAFVCASDGLVESENELLSELRQALGVSESDYANLMGKLQSV